VGSPKVVVVDHYDSYTWNLVHLIAGITGVLPAVVQHDEIAPDFLDDFDHVVLSPGPGHPADLRDFSLRGALSEELRVEDQPILGVCLGMQGIVTAYGGTVSRGLPAHGEIEKIRHDGAGVFAGLPQQFKAVRYHSLEVLLIPDCLELTATTDDLDVVMGVRHRTKPIEGVQFHPESILSEFGEAMIRNFLQ
jgi:anthranilate synthase component II